MITATAHLKHRIATADLLTGVVEMSTYAAKGLPPVMEGHVREAPAATLRRILSTVESSDLEGGARWLWGRAKTLGETGARITWAKLLIGAPAEAATFAKWAQTYGMAVAYQAIPAADRVIAWAVARRAIEEARAAQAEAIEAAEASVQGVPG